MNQHTHLGIYSLITANDHVLLIQKGRGPYTGQWDLPGGGIEFGEDPLEALCRELKEETGLAPINPKLFTVFSNLVIYEPQSGVKEQLHHIGIIYRILMPDVLPIKQEPVGEDSMGARWFPLSAVSDLPLTSFANGALNSIEY
jgi:ADP-ribose pyrophosphatase YjhB (NUDIX family)